MVSSSVQPVRFFIFRHLLKVLKARYSITSLVLISLLIRSCNELVLAAPQQIQISSDGQQQQETNGNDSDDSKIQADSLSSNKNRCTLPCHKYRQQLMQKYGNTKPKYDYYQGQCMCGAVRFQVKDTPLRLMHCHCNMCKRQGGGAFITWGAFQDWSIKFATRNNTMLNDQIPNQFEQTPRTTVQPRIIHSSSFAYRRFCPMCGSTIALNYHDQPGTSWLAAGTFGDQDLGCCPDSDIMLNYKAPWYSMSDSSDSELDSHLGLMRFPEGG